MIRWDLPKINKLAMFKDGPVTTGLSLLSKEFILY